MRIMRENGWKRLAITSPNMACGKTTVATNLAFSLARQSDNRVILLDMDMRRPSMHDILSHRDRWSFHDVLEGKLHPEEQLLRFGENLIFGLNYKPANNPAELLQSEKTREILEIIEAKFQPDFILFDMPPMLVSDDNVGFMQNVDCGLLIGAAEETHVTQLDSCEKELAELTNVLGIVLNKCRYMETGDDYDYY
jgi:protein-tyrosine kinase